MQLASVVQSILESVREHVLAAPGFDPKSVHRSFTIAMTDVGEVQLLPKFELGQHGRYRTNVWEYGGVNTFRKGRLDELAMHPTVKPVAMIADAIRDVTRRAEIVLDPFAGSGTAIIAAEKTGRHARAMEYDPGYCDVIVRRWQKYTGKTATLDRTDRTFEDIESERSDVAKAIRQALFYSTTAKGFMFWKSCQTESHSR